MGIDKRNMPSGFKQIESSIFSILNLVNEKHVSVFAAAADCFIFMSLVPILMLLVSLIRFLPFSQADIMQILEHTVPSYIYDPISPIVSSIYIDGSAAFTISLLLTLHSASGAMRQLMKGLDTVYGDERKEPVPIFYLRAILYMLVLAAIFVFSSGILVFGSQILDVLHAALPENILIRRLFSSARLFHYVLVLCFLFFSFLLLYWCVPARRHKLSRQWPGAVFSAFAWVVFSWGFSIYVSVSNKFGAYGYIGTIMVAMMWVYFCLTFLLVGGCINAFHEQSSTVKSRRNLS